ncbi:MAG: SGNH/GDSL hydrolase family protein, partial [Deltaproteobacteria bacterium]|nr:SGNH/GDSL hydrolase family protein [Kofleriaceae bacterium]
MKPALAALALLAAGEARAAKVVAFGDSWGAFAYDELAAVFVARGHPEVTVANHAVPGSTAEVWANTFPGVFAGAVAANPDAEYVWLSITGNDVFGHYASGNGAACAADNSANLRAMLDEVFAAHPNIQVVSFGYDFVNFEQSPECIL